MNWKIEFSSSAEKEFSKAPKDYKKRIIKFLEEKVLENPRAHGTALQGNFNNIKLWRYRVGDYRIICQIKDNELIVLLLCIGKRDTIYKSIN